jgi:hypothetical protein
MSAKIVLKNIGTKFFTILKQTFFSKGFNFIVLNLKTPNEKNIKATAHSITMPAINIYV